MKYKRNQIEEAISKLLEPGSLEPSSELRTRLKRLLETDRALGRSLRSTDPGRAHYAFYSADAAGSGVEVWFSEYETFALLNALRLMGHSWPQSFAVLVLRRMRSELEGQHARILKQDSKWLFDQDEIRRNARAGDMALDNRDPVLLTIVSKRGGGPSEQDEPSACAVCRGPIEAMEFVRQGQGSAAGGWTMFELVSVAFNLSKALANARPRLRGRGQ
jgi:hypothetical protein